MAKKIPPQQIIEAFILRARRIMAHSLIRDHGDLMRRLASGEFKLSITKNTRTGEESHRVRREFPPEETMESLASRVRPLMLRGESEAISHENVLTALEDLVGTGALDAEIDIEWWRAEWRDLIDGNGSAQAYALTTDAGSITDRKLMHAWIYGDVVHAKVVRSEIVKQLTIEHRYHAAAPGIARICDLTIKTYLMVEGLIAKGLLEVAPTALTNEVVVSETVYDVAAEIHVARHTTGGPPPEVPEVGAEPEPEVWQSPLIALTEAGLLNHQLARDEFA